LRIDPRLTSTALAHLLENAAQYAPAGSPVDIVTSVDNGEVRFEVRVTDRTGDVVLRIDPRLTSTALGHLLENAAQYSPAGSAVDIVTSVDSGEARFEVRDRGRGIAPEERARLFDRFYRGLESVRHPFGSGLGLAITRGLLVAQGGRVWADNHPEGGAVFTIAVPCGPR